MKVICFDTETTALYPGQIGQLSLVMTDDEDGKLQIPKVEARNYFFSVDEVSQEVKDKFGRDELYYLAKSQGVSFADKAEELRGLFDGAYLVAHNIRFDKKFISMEFWRLGMSPLIAGELDTMTAYKDIVKSRGRSGQIKLPKLEEVVNHLNLSNAKILNYAKQLFGDSGEDITYHDSRFDTACLFIIYNVLVEMQSAGLEQSAWANYYR